MYPPTTRPATGRRGKIRAASASKHAASARPARAASKHAASAQAWFSRLVERRPRVDRTRAQAPAGSSTSPRPEPEAATSAPRPRTRRTPRCPRRQQAQRSSRPARAAQNRYPHSALYPPSPKGLLPTSSSKTAVQSSNPTVPQSLPAAGCESTRQATKNQFVGTYDWRRRARRASRPKTLVPSRQRSQGGQ